jgi:TonB family protein
LSAELSAEAIDAIVMHEVAHIRRYDVWTNALARVLEALLTLNPFAWFVLARLSVEREIACDDWVVARLDAGEVFANALAKMAFRPAFASIAAPSAIGSKRAVVARIERLLDRRPRRLRLSAAALTSVLVLLTIFATTVPTISPVLAFAPSTEGCNHTVLVEGIDTHWRPTGRWIPITHGNRNPNDPRNTVMDVTVDARGKLVKTTVISTPHARDAAAATRFLAMQKYRSAVVNCKAVASTVRIVGLINIAPPGPISIVRANYPYGWSSEHPGACRVPDLTHGGVPDVRLVTNKPVTASVLVHVDASGNVTNATIMHSSGNTTYDNGTLAAARRNTYPLADGFKPVRPSGASLSWNASHGYSQYSKCAPRPDEYTWTTTFPAAEP